MRVDRPRGPVHALEPQLRARHARLVGRGGGALARAGGVVAEVAGEPALGEGLRGGVVGGERLEVEALAAAGWALGGPGLRF